MSEVAEHLPEHSDVTVSMGAAVLAYCFEQKLNGAPMPDPSSPEQVAHVMHTVALHTNRAIEEITPLVTGIQACIVECHDLWSEK